MMGTMNLIFVIEFPMKKIKDKLDVVCNNSCYISGENFVKYIFVTITLSEK